MAAGAAFRPDRSSSGIGHGGAHFSLACTATLFTTSMTVSGRARGAGHQHLLYRDGRLRHGAGGVRTNESHQADGNHHLYRAGSADHWPAFRCGADALRPLEGAVRHYCGNGFYRLYGPVAGDAGDGPARRGAVSAINVVRDFSRCLSQPRVPLWRRHDLAKLHPNDELGRRFPGDPDRRGWHDVLPVRLGTGSGVRCGHRRQHGRCSFL